MGMWWRRVMRFLRAPLAGTFDSAPKPIDQVIAAMLGVSGSRVSRADAMSVPAVQRARNTLCSISTLPLVQCNARLELVRNPLLEQIDRDVANVVTLAQTVEDLLCESIAWWRITERDPAGFPTFARRLDPSSVSLDPPVGRSAPLPSGVDPRAGKVVWIDGQPVGIRDVIRFDSPNPALLTVGARAIRRAILLDKAAAMYADDPRPLDYFTPADGADPIEDDEVKEILAEWKDARKRRSTGYVPAALKYNTVDAPSPADLQLVQLQRQASLDLANALGVDPEELGVSTTSRTYFNATDRRQHRVNDVLSPYMQAIAQRLSMGDVTRRGHKVSFDLDGYMRVDPITRVQYYQGLSALNAITTEEIRVAEDMPPMPEQPAPEPAPPAGPPPADPAAPPAAPPRDNAAPTGPLWERLRPYPLAPAATFADDGAMRFADLPVTGFTVDRQRRTIEGIALPYGSIGSKGGLKFKFLKGSLRWSSVNRVKLLRDHDLGNPVGVAVDLTNLTAGLRTKFKVARGPEGDRVLSLAEDGVLDGLSVGVDFDFANDVEMDPDDESVMLVRRADLREVSLTAMPAFDDARVTKVAASRNQGVSTMDECATCGQRHAVNAACPTTPPANDPPAPAGMTLSQDQVTALLSRPGALDALVQAQQAAQQQARPTPAGGLTLSAEQVDALIRSGGLATLIGLPQVTPAPRPAAPEQERPETVDPTRRTVAASHVNEPLPYRFDARGNLTRGAEHDFSTDLYNAFRGDGEAMSRATKFLKAQEHVFADPSAAMQFGVATTDVTALNPNRQRPDLYVDQKDFAYPIWDAINKGTLSDVTPFVLPKFNTSSGLVAAHTQGVEPSDGTFTGTSQTITPSPNSGKISITREAWDQGGNPQLSGLIWTQMLRAWFEGLEAAAVTLLEGLAPTTITLTTASQDDVLQGDIESALASLQFVRGGLRMRDLFLQIDLYKALVNATDANGRKLFPMLGAVNANGSVSELFADINVAGLRGRPAWALAASGTVSANSYLFDRNDVSGWASAPQRLQFETQVKSIEIGIWGYKAVANTDLTGVRRIAYDPV